MSSNSGPNAVLTALGRTQDAFEMVERGRTEFEERISADADWKTQLTKVCRLLEVVETLQIVRTLSLALSVDVLCALDLFKGIGEQR